MIEAVKIKKIADQASRQNECRIYDIYRHKDRLQIFIDKQIKNTDIQLKDCENVFHSLRFLLHSEMPHILENFRLEVSSPGIEKRLRAKWHFEESIGKLVKLTTNLPIKAVNKKTGKSFSTQAFKAHLLSLSEERIHLKKDFTEYSVTFSQVKSAQILFEQVKKPRNKRKSEVSHVS